MFYNNQSSVPWDTLGTALRLSGSALRAGLRGCHLPNSGPINMGRPSGQFEGILPMFQWFCSAKSQRFSPFLPCVASGNVGDFFGFFVLLLHCQQRRRKRKRRKTSENGSITARNSSAPQARKFFLAPQARTIFPAGGPDFPDLIPRTRQP